MKARLSRVLTVTTVGLLGTLLLILALDQMTDVNLAPLISSLSWALGALVLLRMLAGIKTWRSKIADPIIGSASVQSRIFGFTPGGTMDEDGGKSASTESSIEAPEDLRRRRGSE